MFITNFVSGAFFNPAIVFSALVRKLLDSSLTKTEFLEFFLFTIVQFSTGIIAGLLSWQLVHQEIFFDFKGSNSAYKAFFCEVLFTGILCFNALMSGKVKNGLLLETAVVVRTGVAGGKTIGHISGNCLNPVAGISLNVVYYIVHRTHLENLWVYVFAPYAGGLVAGVGYYLFNQVLKKNRVSRTSLVFNRKNYELKDFKN